MLKKCHNPESWESAPEMSLRRNLCLGCGRCVEACPEGAITMGDDGPVTDLGRCTVCGACVDACPAGAREILGRSVTVDHVMARVERDVPFYEQSGGGVTFSGGEPMLPREIVRGYLSETSFDAGRGCPFQCTFCTIINVQGRKSRHRTDDDVEQVIRANLAQGVHKFFITDDNFARNKNWEPIFDRMIEMREQQGLHFKFLMQVDTQCYKIPRLIDKAARAGCSRVFIGMESIASENLAAAGKVQNHVEQYRTMLQMWRDKKVVTVAGYILGFPADTPESIARDIATIQRELPIDMVEFFCLTPLPGSADHQALHRKGAPMETDMNNYDLEHITTDHPRMSAAEWRNIYDGAWHLYYSPEHIATLLRRARAGGIKLGRITWSILFYYGAYRFERVHPLQCGVFRRKVRTSRRPGLPRVNPLVFYPKRLWEIVSTYGALAWFAWKLDRLRRRIEREPEGEAYVDEALERSRHILPLPVAPQEPTSKPISADPVVISLARPRRAA